MQKKFTGKHYLKEDTQQNILNLKILRQNCKESDPYKGQLDYKSEFESLDLDAVKEDIKKVMTTSQPWWPADYGHYGPLFIRLAWHSAGTYRIIDGRGGANRGIIRFWPVRSWPDNINLDKAIRLLWPVKKKYGKKISWADLIILAGNVALESMGFKTLGFAGGRIDVYEHQDDIYWGKEEKWLDNKRFEDGTLEHPLAAVQMGLIYVNPEGPNGEPNVLEAAKHIRLSFRRMGMNDEETVALIAGGHSFGKAHGAASVDHLGPEPDNAPIEQQGLGWKNSYKTGKGPHTITSGLEGSWVPDPIKWSNSFLRVLFKYEWNLEKSPAGAWIWVAVNPDPEDMVPDAHIEGKYHKPIMFTTDLALKMDPGFSKIAKRFLENPDQFAEAFAKAWFKLTHRDLGPVSRYLGKDKPKQVFPWQDPLPERDFNLIDKQDEKLLKEKILASGLSISELVYTAWSAASTFRGSDFKGGVNGARIRLKPQKDWEVNMPNQLEKVISVLEKIQQEFNSQATDNKKVSLADLIVLGGNAAIELAAKKAGFDIEVPFTPGRVDATEEMTDLEGWKWLEPVADGFRNYFNKEKAYMSPEEHLIDKAQLLTLTVPEMTVLIGGLRVLKANYNNTDYGVLTDRPLTLTNDFFVNLMDTIEWKKIDAPDQDVYVAIVDGKEKWKATRVDLIFGANDELRAVAEVYAMDDALEKFINDFVEAWVKVMELDRFDIKS